MRVQPDLLTVLKGTLGPKKTYISHLEEEKGIVSAERAELLKVQPHIVVERL